MLISVKFGVLPRITFMASNSSGLNPNSCACSKVAYGDTIVLISYKFLCDLYNSTKVSLPMKRPPISD